MASASRKVGETLITRRSRDSTRGCSRAEPEVAGLSLPNRLAFETTSSTQMDLEKDTYWLKLPLPTASQLNVSHQHHECDRISERKLVVLVNAPPSNIQRRRCCVARQPSRTIQPLERWKIVPARRTILIFCGLEEAVLRKPAAVRGPCSESVQQPTSLETR